MRSIGQGAMDARETGPSPFDRVDAAVEAAARAVARRDVGKRALAVCAGALGIHLLAAPTVQAQSVCNVCVSPCSDCAAGSGWCCSPNGQYCRAVDCTCSAGCSRCGWFRAFVHICNDGFIDATCVGCN